MKLTRSPLAPDHFPDLPAVKGMRSATHSLGMYNTDRDDLLVVDFPNGAMSGGVFTRSLTRSCDIDWCRKALEDGKGHASGLIVNAGNSNAFTFQHGIAKNDATLSAFEAVSGKPKTECFIGATGVVGVPVKPGLVGDVLPEVWPELSEDVDWLKVASAIMTTDTFPKGSGRQVSVGGKTVSIAGVAKGSGMIAPNMATMLAYVFTDAPLTQSQCQWLTSQHTNASFNSITVDGDTSTSDTAMLFATGGADLTEDELEACYEDISAAIGEVFLDLAHQIVRDGEGASKFVEIEVTGALNDNSAKVIACSIANSPLVKTALAASDANWGRIVMAVGKSLEPVNRDHMTITIGDVLVAEAGQRAASYDEAEATRAVSEPEIRISVDVAVGGGQSRVWTCDLTHGYVEINGAYRT
ncbi:MAG: bifunctional ornithine acetyltransferase/N-acetylglutamate synthase [Ponticaulis sp.]|nr:bifunctional ornithine acetyltransferase/N-acetylglutamate synthase [Ponticaulis sp.]